MNSTYLKSNGARLWDSLMEMAKIGATANGGCNRVAFSEEDRQGRDLFVEWCQDADCTVSVDRFGNIFARRPGRRDDLPVVMAGSHLDTQPTGGKFDGVYGVLAGLEVVRSLNDHGIETEAPIEVAVWTNEEGCIFKPMLGSAVFTGLIPIEKALEWRDEAEGWTIREALERTGYAGEMSLNSYPVGCYFEAHIEQGPILEANGTVVGVVTAAQGQRWYDLELAGQEAHAGPTPMEVRRDAMMGAARVVLEIDRIGRSRPNARGTAGRMNVFPNSPNTVPGRVAFSGDLRHPDEAILHAMDQEFRASAERIADEWGLQLSLEEQTYLAPLPFHPALVDTVRRYAKEEGKPHQDIYTGAGHDACQMGQVYPTAMIFVPCEGGISHNESENAKPEDLEAGCNVLCNAMRAVACGEVELT
ncbi:MAG: Zn-dependent hydrolase [Pseudomonadota bacterium]